MFKRFLAYYKPHMRIFTLDMIASFFIALIGLFYPILTRQMLNDFIPAQNFAFILLWGFVLLILYFIRMLLRYFVQYAGHVMGVKMQADMRKEMFSHLQKLPYAYYDEQETGKIMSRMTNDLDSMSELAHHGPENLFICGFLVIASFSYLCLINWLLTSIIFICVPLLIIISLYMRKKMNYSFMERRKKIAIINAALESSISGIRVTKAFTNQQKEEDKFDKGNMEYVEASSQAYKTMGQFSASTQFVTDLFNIIVLVAGGIFMAKGIINFADLSAFIVSINMFITPLTTLINFVEMYENGVSGFKRFLEIMDEPIEIEKENALTLKVAKGDIEFKNVYFSYNESEAVLKNINLKIESGKKIALVGQSGGGKTTICHLIPNFYQIDSGSIIIDGIDIRDLTLNSLRENIGIVQQDVFLFNGTIKENILYGKLNASDEEIIAAAKKANIHDYVMQMSEGYATIIGERGVKLSGGQKQRLAIARVFLKNPAILILDEATSALDNTTEILIQNALDELCIGRTTLVVAHRLSTIKNADEIVVINDGVIIEKGPHEQLLKNQGIYNRLYQLQFRESTDSELLINQGLSS